MDAYLTCFETKKAVWLGKPIRFQEAGVARVEYYNRLANEDNHANLVLNKILWKFLAEHAKMELKVLFSGDFDEEEYEEVATGFDDVKTDLYLEGWPRKFTE
jgi:hypothetical protein